MEYSEDPLMNIVYDEVLFEFSRRVYREPLARIWVNPCSVVIGYSLDWCEEVYCDEAERLGVPIVRRFTGGGAVYHDPGNINIAVAVPTETSFTDIETVFREATDTILGVLRELGLEAGVENMSDVVVRGYKVSGTSAALRHRGYFYHSTLLVSADIEMLKRLIKPRTERVLRGEVTPAKYRPANLRDFIDTDVREVIEVSLRFFEKIYRGGVTVRGFSREERREAERLYREKYLPRHMYGRQRRPTLIET